MNTAGTLVFRLMAALFVLGMCMCPAMSGEADITHAFNQEEIKPYIKIMGGPWVGNSVAGTRGSYRIAAKLPRDSEYVLGLFDNKVSRTGVDARSAVVLVDGVNPLAPKETVATVALDGADVSSFRKYPFDGIAFNSKDSAGKDCYVKIVDKKEEYAMGAVQPFTITTNRRGALGRIDIYIFAAPAYPEIPGQTVRYDKPILKYSLMLSE